MAEGLAREVFPGAEVYSAGSQPGVLNPMAVIAMAEIKVDISQHYSKGIDAVPKTFLQKVDYVITLCEEEVCPTLPESHGKKLHWPLPDPARHPQEADPQSLTHFRQVRDRIQKLLNELRSQLSN